ncbi:MAG: hypothetical protein WCH39_28420 [Schlesneria sp.]
MIPEFRLTLIPLLLAAIVGCGRVETVPDTSGGTTGKIHNGREPLVGIQVTVYQVDGDSTEPIGVAASRLDGSFELATMDGTCACQLPAGEFRCTLESAGAPIAIPTVFAKPETTPLKIVLSKEDEAIDLKVPQLKNDR